MNGSQEYVKLNAGITMPMLGLGVYDMHEKEAENAVTEAINIGYRLIDTAASYGNEKQIGDAIRNSAIARADLFLTTKVANGDQGYDSTMRAFDKSLEKLQLDYVDLYLVHWPIRGKRKDTWKALEKLYAEKRVKSIGVANYLVPFLEELKEYADITPAVNQVEFSPYLYLEDLLQYCVNAGIQLQSYTPLIRGRKFDDPRLLKIAAKYIKTPAQIILRWNLQKKVSPIPKSSNNNRLKENFDLFDFSLSSDDMAALDQLNENYRVVDDPITYW